MASAAIRAKGPAPKPLAQQQMMAIRRGGKLQELLERHLRGGRGGEVAATHDARHARRPVVNTLARW